MLYVYCAVCTALCVPCHLLCCCTQTVFTVLCGDCSLLFDVSQCKIHSHQLYEMALRRVFVCRYIAACGACMYCFIECVRVYGMQTENRNSCFIIVCVSIVSWGAPSKWTCGKSSNGYFSDDVVCLPLSFRSCCCCCCFCRRWLTLFVVAVGYFRALFHFQLVFVVFTLLEPRLKKKEKQMNLHSETKVSINFVCVHFLRLHLARRACSSLKWKAIRFSVISGTY